jgi:hypothetical protein
MLLHFKQWFEAVGGDDLAQAKASVNPFLSELMGEERDWAGLVLAQIARSTYRIRGGDVAPVLNSVVTFLWQQVPKLRVPKPIPVGLAIQYIRYGIGRVMTQEFGLGKNKKKAIPMSAISRDEENPIHFGDNRRNTAADQSDEADYKQAILDAADKHLQTATNYGTPKEIADAEVIREILRSQVENMGTDEYFGLDQLEVMFKGRIGKTKLYFLLKRAREVAKRAVSRMGIGLPAALQDTPDAA